MGTTETSPTKATATSQGVPTRKDRSDLNVVLVAGQLTSEPEQRILASGSVAFSFSLTVRAPGEKTTSVPAVWYDPPQRALRWAGGDAVVVQGSVVRRFFRGGGGLGSSTEVVVQRGELGRHRAKAERIRQHVGAQIEHQETAR